MWRDFTTRRKTKVSARSVFALGFVLCLVMAASMVSAETNLLRNPGFEEGTGTYAPPWVDGFWGGTGQATTEEARTGDRSWKMVGAGSPNALRQVNVALVEQYPAKYELKGWVKIPSASPENPVQATVRWLFTNGPGGRYDYQITTSDWVQITDGQGGLEVPYGVVELEYRIFVWNADVAYVDDCEVIPVRLGDNYPSVAGTVVYDGIPVPGALVGIKPSASATADALVYKLADADGNFGPVYVQPGQYYVAAWKKGWTAGDDVVFDCDLGEEIVLNVPVGAPGKNVALGNESVLASAEAAGDPVTRVVDGFLRDLWRTGEGGEQSVWMALGPDTGGWEPEVVEVDTVVIYSDMGFPAKYRIEMMTEGDPFSMLHWAQPEMFGAVIETVYESGPSRGGYYISGTHWSFDLVNPIRINATGVGIRIVLLETSPHRADYEIREIVVQTRSEGGMLRGFVTDPQGQPVYNALVQLDDPTTLPAVTDPAGYYEIAYQDAGAVEVYADGPGYAGKLVDVTTVDGLVPYGITLNPKSETGVYNPGFEIPGATPDVADGWNFVIRDTPPQPLAYLGGRTTTENKTPGGEAVGWVSSYLPGYDATAAWPGAYLSQTVPVDPSKTYNFYFKLRMDNWFYGFWGIYWLDAEGEIISDMVRAWYIPFRDNRKWIQLPQHEELGWANNFTRMTPPENAVAAEIRFGIMDWGHLDPHLNVQFYIDDVVFDGFTTDVEYEEVATLAEAKGLADGTLVSVVGKALTAVPGLVGVPAGVAYVGEADRSAGLRLDVSGVAVSQTIGDAVSLQGTIATTAAGEKCIVVTSLTNAGPATIAPLGMNNRFAGTALARALSVKLWGTVTAVGADYFVINDGSGTPIQVVAAASAKPTAGEFVTVNGVLTTDGANAVLLLTEAID
jgi:hypothetical protein